MLTVVMAISQAAPHHDENLLHELPMESTAYTRLGGAMQLDEELTKIANRLCIEDRHFAGLWNRYTEQAAQLQALVNRGLGSDDEIDQLEQAHRHLWTRIYQMIDSARRANSV